MACLAYRGVEPSETMHTVYRHNFLYRTGRAPLDCRSPEDFCSIAPTGRWQSHTL